MTETIFYEGGWDGDGRLHGFWKPLKLELAKSDPVGRKEQVQLENLGRNEASSRDTKPNL